MKCILKALRETEYKPRQKWWGFVKDNKRFLMRYNHCFIIFDLETKKIVDYYYETKTDKAGVLFAIKILEEKEDE